VPKASALSSVLYLPQQDSPADEFPIKQIPIQLQDLRIRHELTKLKADTIM
jgi:hypothetical protein